MGGRGIYTTSGDASQPNAAILGHTTLDEYAAAPTARQIEIYRFLISYSLDDKQPDIVRQNAFNALGALHAHCNQEVILTCAVEYVARIGRKGPRVGEARVAYQAGILPYLKKSQLIEMYSSIGKMLEKHSYTFRNNAVHGKLLRSIGEVGGIRFCPSEALLPILRWLVLCYIREAGGYGRGRGRNVFYSNSGAPLALELIKNSGMDMSEHLNTLREHDPDIRRLMGDE